MDKVAFLPFGLLVDKWRWGVFDGTITPATYNSAWVDLKKQYQGIVPPVDRPANAFDPGAKYHIPGNTPYTRYFLARILQFQFYQAACKQAGWKGPLHRCSFYGNKEVGQRLNAMLAMGGSRPWPEALEAFTGTREMSGKPMLEYFAPLQAWRLAPGLALFEWVGLFGLTVVYARGRGVRLASVLRLRKPSATSVAGAILVGGSAWLVVGLLAEWVLPPPKELVEKLRDAITPAQGPGV